MDPGVPRQIPWTHAELSVPPPPRVVVTQRALLSEQFSGHPSPLGQGCLRRLEFLEFIFFGIKTSFQKYGRSDTLNLRTNVLIN